MPDQTQFTRPTFDEALVAWKTLLAQRALPTDLLWVFDENLCFEKDPGRPGGFRLGIQTALTPPPPEAEHIAYEHFSDSSAPLVFYRIGSSRGKSVCLLLCDEWFAARTQADGFEPRQEWRMLFRPGPAEEVEEITDAQRWKQRMLRDRPLHDLDFCMTLRAVHETLAHGRVLSAYEHYALRFLHAWRRLLGQPD
jgi:hypothetical protein